MTTTEVATIITPEHTKVGHHMIDLTLAVLHQEDLEIAGYSVQNEAWDKSETLKLKAPNGAMLTLHYKRP